MPLVWLSLRLAFDRRLNTGRQWGRHMQTSTTAANALQAQTAAPSRPLRPDERITIRRARFPAEKGIVQALRWNGGDCHYDRYAPQALVPATAANVVVLLAIDDTGQAVGSVRLMDRRCGPSELDRVEDARHVVVNLPENSIEVAQFSALSTPLYRCTKLLLWKSVYLWCVWQKI